MTESTSLVSELRALAESPELLHLAHVAVEEELIDRRDSGIFLMRGNGLVCRWKDGEPSDMIRMSVPEAIATALRAMADKLEKGD